MCTDLEFPFAAPRPNREATGDARRRQAGSGGSYRWNVTHSAQQPYLQDERDRAAKPKTHFAVEFILGDGGIRSMQGVRFNQQAGAVPAPPHVSPFMNTRSSPCGFKAGQGAPRRGLNAHLCMCACDGGGHISGCHDPQAADSAAATQSTGQSTEGVLTLSPRVMRICSSR